MDSDRSDRQRANSKYDTALHSMYSPSQGWSPAARLLSGPGRGNHSAQQGRLEACSLSRRRPHHQRLERQRNLTSDALKPACQNGEVLIGGSCLVLWWAECTCSGKRSSLRISLCRR